MTGPSSLEWFLFPYAFDVLGDLITQDVYNGGGQASKTGCVPNCFYRLTNKHIRKQFCITLKADKFVA